MFIVTDPNQTDTVLSTCVGVFKIIPPTLAEIQTKNYFVPLVKYLTYDV